MSQLRSEKVPIQTPYGLEFVDQRRARLLALARNAANVVRNRQGQITRMALMPFAELTDTPGRHGNPQRLTHMGETQTNPPRVIEFKRLDWAVA